MTSEEEMRMHRLGLVTIVGVDGAGKSTLATLLRDEFRQNGVSCSIVWSRFHNFLSKPWLALTRLSGHNYYQVLDGRRHGFHDFEQIPWYGAMFATLQAVDVNLAAKFKIVRKCSPGAVVICERGPWDTLVDVMADTGIHNLHETMIGRLYSASVKGRGPVVLIDRPLEKILQHRPELVIDRKLGLRRDLYLRLAERYGWSIVANDGELRCAFENLSKTVVADATC